MVHSERSGLLLALAGFAMLATGDAIIKTMSGAWSPIAVAALRFTIGATALAVILLVKEGRGAFIPRSPWLQIGRGICLAGATLCFFSAIFVMPLAEATALIFVSPIFTALLSKPLLGEQVKPVTWIASPIALVGVMLVLRPNLGAVGAVALLPLASAFMFSLMLLANRKVAGEGSALSMQAFMGIVAAPLLIIAAFLGRESGAELLQFGWPDWTVAARCALVALTASTAHWLVYLGTTRAGAATIAPMTYVQLLVAAGLGWILFKDAPDLMTFAGAAIIIVAGLLIWWQGQTAPVNRAAPVSTDA